MTRSFQEAIEALDADIFTAEARVAALRAKRRGIEEFLSEYLSGDTSPAYTYRFPTDVPVQNGKSVSGDGPSVVVENVLAEHNIIDFSIDQLVDLVAHDGHDLTREKVSNGVSYLRRKHIVVSRPGRGNWRRIVAGDDAATHGDSLDDRGPAVPENTNDAPDGTSFAPAPSPFTSEAATG